MGAWNRPRWSALAIVVAAGLSISWCSSRPVRFVGGDAKARSSDFHADLVMMCQTQALPSDPEQQASTDAAIQAASRVFNTVELVRKTGAEVVELLGSPTRSNQSVYRGQPFWPLASRGMIYRFDCGMYGWQFNVYCGGDDQLVTEVERRWIH
ncbi:MAG: hypothetical protein ACI9S9_000690 [Planctomycetota bacterium]|jgi:hypothetical protein